MDSANRVIKIEQERQRVIRNNTDSLLIDSFDVISISFHSRCTRSDYKKEAKGAMTLAQPIDTDVY